MADCGVRLGNATQEAYEQVKVGIADLSGIKRACHSRVEGSDKKAGACELPNYLVRLCLRVAVFAPCLSKIDSRA